MSSRRLLQSVEQIKEDLSKKASPVKEVLWLNQLARDHNVPISDLMNPMEIRTLCVENIERQLAALKFAANSGSNKWSVIRDKIIEQVNHLSQLIDPCPELDKLRSKIVQLDVGHTS